MLRETQMSIFQNHALPSNPIFVHYPSSNRSILLAAHVGNQSCRHKGKEDRSGSKH